MDRPIRAYDAERDLDAVVRMWLEIGWIDDADKRDAVATYLASGRCEVAEVDGAAECLALWLPGSICYQDDQLPLCALNAVSTSMVGRKLGLASALSARALAAAASEGAAVAILGMFEQGFYDRLGFGTGDYDHQLSFDPAALQVGHVPYRRPVRLAVDDAEEMHAAMARRLRAHGSAVLGSAGAFRGEVGMMTRPLGLGYRDQDGTLTHFALGPLEGERGPWRIDAIAYRNTDQLLELLRMVRETGDQIRTVQLIEPAHVQLQVLLRRPLQAWEQLPHALRESGNRALAWYQLRILDLGACIEARCWLGPELVFNLVLSDPCADLAADLNWAGVGGEYTVRVGESSQLAPGTTAGLPTLTAGVAAFSRLWFGVRPASSLALTDELAGPAPLLRDLDEALCLPPPRPGWDL